METMSELKQISCPCIIIGAPSSGSGKTTLTAALARWHTQQGRTVRIFKAGPDFIDPMILQQACESNVYSLDFGMMSEQHCRELLYRAAQEADLILIEGVMGLFDSKHSAASIALRFNIPVLVTVDVDAMAETFWALLHGLESFEPRLSVWGCVANRVASVGHGKMLAEARPPAIQRFGMMFRDQNIRFPERHLGLIQAQEIQDLDERLDIAAAQLNGSPITELPPDVAFHPVGINQTSARLKGKTIAIAKDQAFSFIYAANVDFLKEQGAEIVWTSPIDDTEIPECDCLYFPGGYPELYADRLSLNKGYINSVRAFSGFILAECGGMIYLSESLTLQDKRIVNLCGLLPLKTTLHDTLQGIGWQKLALPSGDLLAHSFHYSSTIETETMNSEIRSTNTRGEPGEAVHRYNGITASYLHWYFPSNPELACDLLLGKLKILDVKEYMVSGLPD